MSSEKQKEVTVWLNRIENPTEEQVSELMKFPEKYKSRPFMEGIKFHSKNGSEVHLCFDHEGKVYVGYDGGPKYKNMRDLTNSSEEIVRTFSKDGGDGWVRENRMVPVEIALPYILEFCRTGEIDTSKEVWE